MYRAGEMRGEQPKASSLKGLKVSADLILSPLPDLKSQKGWGLLACLPLVFQSLAQAIAK